MNKYVSNNKGVCPCCNEYLNYWTKEFEEDELTAYHWICVCGARGIEYHFEDVFDGHSVHEDETDDLEYVADYIPIGDDYSKYNMKM